MSVFDIAERWAEDNFATLPGRPYSYDELAAKFRALITQWPGIDTKRWLFIHSPDSFGSFFEVSANMSRMMLALAKLKTIEECGGMLVGADFSEHWGTEKCVGKMQPLVVCKPLTGENDEHGHASDGSHRHQCAGADDKVVPMHERGAKGTDETFTFQLDPTPEQEELLNELFEEAGEDTITFAPSDTPNEFVRVGRNDPCPCGSGRKFKKCCKL